VSGGKKKGGETCNPVSLRYYKVSSGENQGWANASEPTETKKGGSYNFGLKPNTERLTVSRLVQKKETLGNSKNIGEVRKEGK